MKLTKNQYSDMVSDKNRSSKIVKDTFNAFWCGGLICVLGEFIYNVYDKIDVVSKDDAAVMTTITLILLSAMCTGAGLYQKLAKISGVGTLVPVTGFANAISAAAIEFKTEGLITGVGVKLFVIAGPVIVYGTLASFIYGVILWLISIF